MRNQEKEALLSVVCVGIITCDVYYMELCILLLHAK